MTNDKPGQAQPQAVSNKQPSEDTRRRYQRTEPELRSAVAEWLRGRGIEVETNVVCPTGAADIVSINREAIFEVKHRLTRKALQQAIGQLCLYRIGINPKAQLFVVGYATPDTESLHPHITALGIEIICWQDEASEKEVTQTALQEAFASEHLPSAIERQPTTQETVIALTLQWNIRNRAQAQGLTAVSQLSQAIGIQRQSLYGLWQGTAKNISIEMLERLARKLGPVPREPADPGDWFVWSEDVLIWNISMIGPRVGIFTATQLSHAAKIHTATAYHFWRNEAKFVFIETLAKLAIALSKETNPFNIGDLFIWQTTTQPPTNSPTPSR